MKVPSPFRNHHGYSPAIALNKGGDRQDGPRVLRTGDPAGMRENVARGGSDWRMSPRSGYAKACLKDAPARLESGYCPVGVGFCYTDLQNTCKGDNDSIVVYSSTSKGKRSATTIRPGFTAVISDENGKHARIDGQCYVADPQCRSQFSANGY